MKFQDFKVLSLLAWFGMGNASFAQLTPEQSIARMDLPSGFEAKVFVAEPAITNPLDWAWDHKGRLWVTETVDYPNTIVADNPISGGSDQIKILEDTDGDGAADKITVFASGLNIPAGIALTETGVVVNVTGAMYHLEDTNGDDVMDKSTELYSGFPLGDTHVQENSVKYGLNNKYWVAHGGITVQNNTRGPASNGIFTFTLGDANYEDVYIKSGTAQNWDHGTTEEGEVISRSSAAGTATHVAIPESYYGKIPQGFRGVPIINSNRTASVASGTKIWSGGLKTAGATAQTSSTMGTEVYTARLFPEEYHNKVFFQCDAGLRIIRVASFETNNSTFSTSFLPNLLTSSDDWFSPLRATVGPDGAVWVMDWYDINVAHNNKLTSSVVDPGSNAFEMPRDKEKGRIYRIVPITPPTVDPIPELNKDDIPQLVRTLRHDNRFWRLTAQRLLTYKKSEKQVIVDSILPTLAYANRAEEEENFGTVHAVWTLEGLGAIEDNVDAIYPLLRHPSDAVVMNVLQVLPKNQVTVDSIGAAKVLESDNPHVRLKALLALSDMPAGVSGTLLMRSGDKTADNLATDAVAMAATKVTVGTASNGGNRMSNLSLDVAPPVDFSSNLSTSLGEDIARSSHLAAPVLYTRGDITGISFDSKAKGTVSFYSVSGEQLGVRTLENQKFLEGPLSLSSNIAFYRLENDASQISGKIVRID
jgi:putative membrane-bound dehydrogenase-like protein